MPAVTDRGLRPRSQAVGINAKGELLMNKFFKTPAAGKTVLSPRTTLENQYKTARINLLVAIAFTLINIGMIFLGGGTYFLFSIAVPYILALWGALWCGKLPEEWYEGEQMEFMDPAVMVVMLVIAAIILALYALCFFMSKKNKNGWFVFALVLFSIDTAAMVLILGIGNSIADLIFHAFVIYYLVLGIRVPNKLKALDEAEAAAEAAQAAAEAAQAAAEAAKTAEAAKAAEATEEVAEVAEEQTAEALPDAWAELNARAEQNDQTNE